MTNPYTQPDASGPIHRQNRKGGKGRVRVGNSETASGPITREQYDRANTNDDDDPRPMAIAVTVSTDERDHIDILRRESYELAVERGHMRRG